MLQSLYAEINSYQEKIDNVVRDGRSIIKEEVEGDLIPAIRSDIRSLESTWEMLREKCAAVQLKYVFVIFRYVIECSIRRQSFDLKSFYCKAYYAATGQWFQPKWCSRQWDRAKLPSPSKRRI